LNFTFIENVPSEFTDWSKIEQWIADTVVEEDKVVGDLSFVFMSDDELLDYNIKFLKHDFYTDVITFDDSVFPVISGDILISIDRINDNSNQLNNKYLSEFLRVVIHGVLHLLGYKDKTDLDVLVMRAKEQYYLNKY
jgi:rRNA maturation RNase YbeY